MRIADFSCRHGFVAVTIAAVAAGAALASNAQAIAADLQGTFGPLSASVCASTGQPSIEDFGEATLVNGRARVALDSRFAQTIDPRSAFLVFITPEGDSNVLYVAQKSQHGFSVIESHGGRDSIGFQYRIIGKPFGSTKPRLPIAYKRFGPAAHTALPNFSHRPHH